MRNKGGGRGTRGKRGEVRSTVREGRQTGRCWQWLADRLAGIRLRYRTRSEMENTERRQRREVKRRMEGDKDDENKIDEVLR